jgi:hypothetical protein
MTIVCVCVHFLKPIFFYEGMELTDEVCRKFENSIKRLKFLDDLTLMHYEKRYPRFSVQQCEIMTAIGNMIYGVINKDLP